MNKKFFLGLGVTALTISAAFAGNAFAKRAVTQAYYSDGLGICQQVTLSAPHFTNTGLTPASIKTDGGSNKALFTTRIGVSQCGSTPIKFNP